VLIIAPLRLSPVGREKPTHKLRAWSDIGEKKKNYNFTNEKPQAV
jgi:hypothetical protein